MIKLPKVLGGAIPQSINIIEDIKPHIKNWNSVTEEKIKYLLNTITLKTFEVDNDKRREGHFVNEWTALDSQVLKKLLGDKDYSDIVNAALKSGVLETLKNSKGNASYTFGAYGESKCKRYRYTKDYRNEYLKAIEITNKAIINKIHNRDLDVRKKLLKKPIYANILASIKELRYDKEFIFEYLKKQNYPIEKYNSYFLMFNKLINLNNDNCIFTWKEHKRLYHNITCLPNEILNLCYWNGGAELVEIDISNSAPYLMISLLNKHFGEVVPADVKEYIKSVCNGRLYDDLLSYLGNSNPTKPERDMFKMEVCKYIFFGKNHKSKLFNQFEKIYPSVARFIQVYKHKDKNKLCIDLFKVEGKLIFNNLLPKLRNHKKDMLIITKHDAIITSQEYIDVVKFELEAAGVNVTGYKPHTKIKIISK